MQNAGWDQSKRNAWQSSSWLESHRCGEPCSNVSCITMKSGTIRGWKSHIVSFSDGGKKGHGSSAVSRTTGRPAEVLREGSGIKVCGTAGDGLTISTSIKDPGNLPWQKTS